MMDISRNMVVYLPVVSVPRMGRGLVRVRFGQCKFDLFNTALSPSQNLEDGGARHGASASATVHATVVLVL
jgi:hypothetical protein